MGYGITKQSARKWVLPIQITVPNDFPSLLLTRLKNAANSWNTQTGLPLFVFIGLKTSIVSLKKQDGAGGSFTAGDGGLGKPIKDVNSILSIGTQISDHNILHELGHVLGLAHEEERPGDKTQAFYSSKKSVNPKVQSWLLDAQWDNCRNNQKQFGYMAHGDFDANSVMKYGNSNGTLSAGDIAVVQAIYG
ncbi:M57 family metalloprotease [Agaribacterium sp. ZY112]|uniref:M57 family metalloprotease n=1 Tax=Agaribacterium sp. ZY112 TaxID=3233574 RepID=UPI003526AFCD